MKNKKTVLFCDYFDHWIEEYKDGAIREVTMKKYQNTSRWLRQIAPDLKLKDVTRREYQFIINQFAQEHEKQTVQDFHHQLKSSLKDAIDDDYIKKDPTRKVNITGKLPTEKKTKYISESEIIALINDLDLGDTINYDWMIYLAIKTGLRFSEAAALTVRDFDFKKKTITVNKTWNYKFGGGFTYTKNQSSVRVVKIDSKLAKQFKGLCNIHKSTKNVEMPIFVLNEHNIFNSTVNDILRKHCLNCGIPVITFHGLRHMHASLLLKERCSIASIAARLGHSNSVTCQKVYLHVIKELEMEDSRKIEKKMSSL